MSKLNCKLFGSSFALFLELIKKLNMFTYIVGSKAAFFSLSQTLSPVIGLFGEINHINYIFLIRTLITLFTSKFALYICLLYHIPTFCGALYFLPQFRKYKFLIPLICIILFICDPIGSKAYIYSFYWFIPIFIALWNPKSIFLQALGSTFTTHAVGSIVYLYTNSLSVENWHNLIFVVWAERLIFAITMTCIYYVLFNIKNHIKDKTETNSLLNDFKLPAIILNK